MSDPKRVALTSSLMTAGSSRFGAEFLAPTDKSAPAASSGGKNGSKSLRLKVELFQTDSNKYPEFDYAKLLHVEKKKIKKLKHKSNGFSDPFEENDDDIARMAKELERKYGSAYVSGRGKSKRDEIDIGLGYDESDSFIDNTEAYDELIPDEVETIEGGFYINCGALEFKKLHNESMTTKTDEIIKMPNRPKKMVISSSSEDSSSSGDDDDDDDDDDDSEDDGEDDDDSAEEASVETAKSKSSSSGPADKKSKPPSTTTNPAKKKAPTAATENGGAAKKKKLKNVASGVSAGSSSNSPKPPTDDLASDSERERIAKKIEKTTTVKDMLKAQRDNFLKSQTTTDPKTANGKVKGDDGEEAESSDGSDDGGDESDNNSDSNQSAAKPQTDKKSASSNEENQGNEKLRSTDTKLPEMEPEVLASIVEFRDGLKAKNLVGKKLQFDDQLSESFLKIDDYLLCIDKAERSMVYAHLEYQLSLPRYFFFRKARQLREKEEKLKSKRAFNKLHKAVTETMPAVIVSYDAELRRYAELQAANVNSDQPPKMPKKKFPWNPNLRNLLYDVYQVRWTSYPVLGKKKDTLEEFITTYMSKKVVEIWPKGWMRYEELQKEIEKRKTAAKKAKEKAKPASASAVTAQPTTSTTSSSQNPTPESATRSNTNSDTDSVASSNTSCGLKRKNTDAITSNKQSKSKAAKLNGEQKSTNLKNIPTGMDLTSPNKKTDHSINHIISPTSAAAAAIASSMASTTASSIFSATVAAISQPLKHSNNTHIIDLDNYTCSNDIMQQAAAANAAFSISNVTSLNNSAAGSSSRRESSGDSEIEIVGVFPAKITNKKQKTNSRSGTPNSNQIISEKTYNNNNNNRNTKKQPPSSTVTSGALSQLTVEGYNKLVKSLMDMGDNLQAKPMLSTAAAAQKPAQSSPSPMPSNVPHQ